jgi:hypothetical protein
MSVEKLLSEVREKTMNANSNIARGYPATGEEIDMLTTLDRLARIVERQRLTINQLLITHQLLKPEYQRENAEAAVRMSDAECDRIADGSDREGV